MADHDEPRRRWRVLAVVARVTKALLHGSVFWLLALPLVSLASCGANVNVTGYQALTGFAVPAAAFKLSPADVPPYARDLWVIGLLVLALIGIACAVVGGFRGSIAGLAVSVAGLIVLQPAIGFFSPQNSAEYWTAEAGGGAGGIFVVYVGTGTIDLLVISARSWWEARSTRKPPNPNRAEWAALGCASTSIVALIALGVIALAILAILLRSR